MIAASDLDASLLKVGNECRWWGNEADLIANDCGVGGTETILVDEKFAHAIEKRRFGFREDGV